MVNQDLVTIIKQYGFNEGDVASVKELPSGINRVQMVTVGSKRFVLKEYIKSKSPLLDQIHSELVKLMQGGFPIPSIINNKSGDYLTKLGNRNFDLTEFIEHIDLSDQVHISDSDLKFAAETLVDVQMRLSSSPLTQVLKKVDFEKKVDDTLKAITEFKTNFVSIRNAASPAEQFKLDVLLELINYTDQYRAQGKDEFTKFLNQPFVPTQGDYSMVNVLITESRDIYVIDWDGLGLRPLIWDLQAAISLFSLKEIGNAYIVEPDYHKAELFLSSYIAKSNLTKDQLLMLPEVVKYNFAIYWLSYTLPAVNEHDFRLLFLVPDQVEKGLYWVNHFDEYKEFINKITA